MKTIFHSKKWIDAIAEMQGLKAEQTEYWNYTSNRKYGLPVIQMPVKTPFFSPIGTPEQCENTINFLKKKYWYIHAHYTPDYMGRGNKVHYTYVHDFKDGFNFDSSLREAIKKAEKLDYDFVEGVDLIDCYNLEQKAYKRTGLNLNYTTPEKFRKFVESISEIKGFTILYDGIPLGYYLIALDGETVYAWVSAFDYEFQNTRLNQLLTVRMLEWCKDNGYRYFDFVGADTESIAKYKAQYNFKLISMVSITWKKI